MRGPVSAIAEVPLLIDSGADVSVVPRWVAEIVGTDVQSGSIRIAFLHGEEVSADAGNFSVEFQRFRFEGQFVVGDTSFGVLGRNVLNALTLTLDGPRLQWSI